jgi:hypothetical protein
VIHPPIAEADRKDSYLKRLAPNGNGKPAGKPEITDARHRGGNEIEANQGWRRFMTCPDAVFPARRPH